MTESKFPARQRNYKRGPPRGQLRTAAVLRLRDLGDADRVRKALIEAIGWLQALTGSDDPATRGSARDAIRAVDRELVGGKEEVTT